MTRPAQVLIRTAALLAGAALAACSAAPPGQAVHDPYEAGNRQIHAFNTALDRAFLRPAGRAATEAPAPLEMAVINFSDNLSLPGMVLNDLMQGDIEDAFHNSARFFLNSTLGLAGLFDPADGSGLYERPTDFGETLAVWGVPEGAFVMLPVLGPSTERDAVGIAVDYLLDPLKTYGSDELRTARAISDAGSLVLERGQFGASFDSVLYDSADPYAQTRLVYLQNRRFTLGEPASPEAESDFVDPYADNVGTPAPAAPPGFVDPYEDF